jgi:hypothetical protein
MAYIGFDLDETLGRFSVVEYYTYFLLPHLSLYKSQWSGMYGGTSVPEPPLSAELLIKLNGAFDLFIDCLAEKEREGVGLLRPGIVDIAKRLYELKQTSPPQVKSVVIYSNNGNLGVLQLAGKLIEKLANAPGLFCNYIHWFHPSRRSEVVWGRPGHANKTMNVLREAFQSGTCSSEDIDVEKVYFFDDMIHPDIYAKIGNRYIQNPAYKYDADPVILNECFLKAFKDSELGTDSEYAAYLHPLFRGNPNILGFIQTILQQDQKSLVRKSIRPNNTNFHRRFNQTFPRAPIRHNLFTKALQTSRRLEQKLNTGIELKPNEQEKLNQSRSLITQYETENPNAKGGRRYRKTKKQKRRLKN